ncbi:MAG: hypothetical protein MJ157_01110 [Clostridia bacterium]|nr:hypothetical protein [Clostridia bacterium]
MSEQYNFYANGFQVFSNNKNREIAITFLHEVPSFDTVNKSTTVTVKKQVQMVMTRDSALTLYKLMEKHLQNEAAKTVIKEPEYPV